MRRSILIGVLLLNCLFAETVFAESDATNSSPETAVLDLFKLTPAVSDESFWEQTLPDFKNNNQSFVWSEEKMTRGRILLSAHSLDTFQFEGIPVLEMTAGFSKDEKLKMLKINLWNKGDSQERDFLKLKIALRKFKEKLENFPKRRLKKSMTTAKQQRYKVGDTYVTLLFKKQEYYMIKLTPAFKNKEEATGGKSTKKAFRENLKNNVKRYPDGDVIIENLPMVDQGQKGYCAPATCARILLYYGVDVDMHFLADSLNTKEGTSVKEIEKLLKLLSKGQPFMCRKEKTFSFGRIQKYIDNGIPLMWLIPNHIRIVIGYNKKGKEVIFTDSWGQQFKHSKMSVKEAKRITHSFFILK